MIGPTGLFIRGWTKLFFLLAKYWWVWITLVVFIPTIVASINEGIEQQDLKIPLKKLGLALVSADEQLYDKVSDLDYPKGKDINIIKYITGLSWYVLKNIFVSLWMLLFNFLLFFKLFLFFLGDSSKKLRAVIVSVITMVFLQILVSGIPFKGVTALIKYIIFRG